MQYLDALISSFFSRDEEEGQGLAEYALILALIAIVAIIALIFLGGQLSKILSDRRRLGLVPSCSRRAAAANDRSSTAGQLVRRSIRVHAWDARTWPVCGCTD